MAIAAGGKTIVFTKSGAKVTDKKTGSTSTYKKTSKGFVRTSSSSGGGSQTVVEPKVLLTEKPTVVKRAKLEVTKRRIQPTEKSVKDKLLEEFKIKSALDEQYQQQTITDERRQETEEDKKKARELKTGFSFDVRGGEKVRRGFKGETLMNTPLGPVIERKDGTIRQPTQAELEDLTPKTTITLNPINFVTGFLGAAKDWSNLITKPYKRTEFKEGVKETATNPSQALESIVREFVTNPAGFAGESYSYGKLFQSGKLTYNQGKKLAKDSLRDLKNINTKRINEINKEIKDLKDKGVNERQRNNADADSLRFFKEEKKILEADVKDLNKTITRLSGSKPKKVKDVVKEVREIKKALTPIKQRKPQRNKLKQLKKNLKKQRRTLKDVTISKKLGEFFKQPIKNKKSTTDINVDIPLEKQLITLIKIAFKTSGEAVSKLKKKIKKLYGLDVKIKQTKKGLEVSFIVAKRYSIYRGDKGLPIGKVPTKQQKTGKAIKQRTYIIDSKGRVTRTDKKVGTKTKQDTKLTKKQLKQSEATKGVIEKEWGQFVRGLSKQLEAGEPKAGVVKQFEQGAKKFKDKYGKKAQLIMKPKMVKSLKKQNSKYKRAVSRVKNEIGDTRRIYKQLRKDLNKKGKVFSRKVKQYQIKRNKTKQKTEQLRKQLRKDLTIYKSLFNLRLLTSVEVKNLQQQLNKLKKLEGKIPPPPTPTPKKPKTPIKQPPKPPKKPRRKVPPKPPKKPPVKPPKRPPKPPKKPPKKPKTKDESKVNFKNKLGLIKYKEGNKVKTIRTGLPYYQALRVAAATVDKTLRASMSVEAYGKTKKKVSKPSLRKFRLKKGKNPLVQKLVEYKKYRLDSKGETSKLKATSLLKKEISKYKRRKK